MKSQIDYVELAKNNYLKVIVKDVKNQKKLDKFLELLQSNSKNNYKIEVIHQNEILETINSDELEDTIKRNSTPIDVVSTYIDTIPLESGIEKNLLSQVFEVLYKETALVKGE